VARSIHELSPRRSRPLITVNCGAISENLLESELFGHLKGAFTGAYAAKKGYFEEADGSSIFLDEVAEIPLSAQVKLLRVLQENRFLPVGATSERQTDVRIIAATNRDLEADLRAGRLREDFYYRINELPLYVPPLRERGDDIQLLIQHLLIKVYPKVGLKDPAQVTREAMERLRSYPWPGNVRELEKVLTRLSFQAENGVITAALVGDEIGGLPALPLAASADIVNWNLEEFAKVQNSKRLAFLRSQDLARREFFRSQYFERLAFISSAIELEEGNMVRAARRLNITRPRLYRLISTEP
jgi:transcriptional regulator with GAF, ATPase, and Fis domain